ncbi:hypothetical protein [Thermococcus celer]|nr:hypothetical protein [Thermococcus celer]
MMEYIVGFIGLVLIIGFILLFIATLTAWVEEFLGSLLNCLMDGNDEE